MFKVETPANTDNFAAILAQAWENDKLNRALNDAAVLITGLTRGKIVAWSTANSRWELYDGTVVPEATTMIGIVEYVGSPDTSGGVRVTGVYLDEALTSNTAYYCQADGTLGTTETATFIGVCTDAGRLVMQGRGSGAGGSGASIGTGNYIAEPFSVVPGTGLEVLVNPNRCVIDETAVESTAQTAVALTAKAAQLVFKKKDGTYDKLLPKMTAADLVDTNTVALWFPDGSASVPNAAVGVNGNTLAVTNALTKSGTITAVDGWAGGDAAKGNASDGVYTSANSTGFPTGAAARVLGGFFRINTAPDGTNRRICGYGTFSGGQYLEIYYNSTGLAVYNASTEWQTNYQVEVGKDYWLSIDYDGATLRISINGSLVYSVAVTLSTVAGVLNLWKYPGISSNCDATLHFIEIRNAARTPAQISELAQKLLVPCVGTSTPQYPANPADSNAIVYKFDDASGATVTDDKGTQNGTAVNTTIIDSKMGLGKARQFGASSYIDLGTITVPASVTIMGVFDIGSTAFSYYDFFNCRDVSTNLFIFYLDANTGQLTVFTTVSGVAHNRSFSISATYNQRVFVALTVDSDSTKLYFNSASPIGITTSIPIPTASNPAYIGKDTPNGRYAQQGSSVEYFTLVPRAMTQAEIKQAYDALFVVDKTDIRDALANPAESKIVTYCETSATGIKKLIGPNDPQGATPDWAYGMRIGPMGALNRRKFLGWKYFSGATILKWDNPFDTRDIIKNYVWAEDATGRNETATDNYSDYGVGNRETSANPIRCGTGANGAAIFNNAWKTSGYINAIVEVID